MNKGKIYLKCEKEFNKWVKKYPKELIATFLYLKLTKNEKEFRNTGLRG